jgi:hypothetical protein
VTACSLVEVHRRFEEHAAAIFMVDESGKQEASCLPFAVALRILIIGNIALFGPVTVVVTETPFFRDLLRLKTVT